MGNYCCDKFEENSVTSKKICKKQSLATTEDPSRAKENCQKEILSIIKSQKDISLRQNCPQIRQLKVVGELGKGGQADIYEVFVETHAEQSQESEIQVQQDQYALKQIKKPNSSYKASSIALGSQLLLQNKCPFLIEGLLCCQNQQFMYELMKIAEGGDLSTFIETTIGKGDSFRKLGEQGIKIVLAGVVLGLQYMHHHGFIYCDLKVQNVLIGRDGYPRLADFDLAAKQASIPSQKYQSTMTSVGPQIFIQQTVDRGMDLWALGVLVFTLLYGEPPFTKEDIKDANFIKQCRNKENKYGLKRQRASRQILSLINSLLKFKAQDRLGYKSISQIRRHQFFKGFDWGKYSRKQIESPLAEIVDRYAKKKRQSQKFKVKKYSSVQYQIAPLSKKFQQSPLKVSGRKTKCDIDINSSIEN